MEKKSFVNVSICKSNLASSKKTYYANVCNTGRVSTEELLSLLREEMSYMDVDMVELAFRKLSKLIINLSIQGKSVEFFSLGTFSLVAKGGIKLERNGEKVVNRENYGVNERCEAKNIDISECVINEPSFSLKFEASKKTREELSGVGVNVAIKKEKAPLINSMEAIPAKTDEHEATIIKLQGKDLKIAGDEKNVGIYLKDVDSGECFKIPKNSILRNEPKTLMFVVENEKKNMSHYNIFVATQYVRQGSFCISQRLRVGAFTSG